ncbi:MAG: hypothetical protein GWO24_37470, partial [Akkermansiaceae bacterium]|nr:hypothetical protein [Akkermansiaceae bacterium]
STANGNPSWYLTIPNRYYQMVGQKPPQVARADRKEFLYPITGDYFQNNPKEESSSGAGHAIYTARRFPEEWWNRRAFICEPPMHLVATPRHQNVGDTFQTTRFENNLYASADAWSAPVAAEVGPDGAVWIADWYNPICNHNPFRTHHKLGPGNAHLNDDRDRKHGRIYRVYPKGSKDDPFPGLATVEQCIRALNHPNLFWKLTAQRQLITLADRKAGPRLHEALRREELSWAVHAMVSHALQELKEERYFELRPADVAALNRGSPGGYSADDPQQHPLVRKASVLRLMNHLPADPSLGARLAKALATDPTIQRYRQLAEAFRLAILHHPEGFVRHLIENNLDPDNPSLKR